MFSSIGTSPAPVKGSQESATGFPPASQTTANSWLLLSLRKDLDANGDGKLSFQELDQNRAADNISAEDKAQLAQIDQAAFDAIDQGDGGVDAAIDFGVLAGNKFLWDQIIQHGNPLPSDFLLASLTASGQIADPNALSPEEQKTLTDLQQKLCTSGFESLSPEEKAVVQRAATQLLKVDDSLGVPAGAVPTPEQLGAGVTALTNRLGYETGHTPVASGVEAKNFDYQSLLGGGTGSDQLSLFAYNSVANQVKAGSGSLGQTDQIGTIYVPCLQQEDRETGGDDTYQLIPGETKALSAEQQAFVTEWTQAHGPLTADNVGQLTTDLAVKFPLEAGWSFQTQQIADPWVGQRENLGTLQSQEQQAYREWNPDGTPKVASPTHRAQALAQEMQAFVGAVTTLNDSKAWAIMDYLEGKEFDWKNDLVGDNGLQQLAGLTPDSPQWDQLAADRGDRAVPREKRQKYIDDAKIAISPEQAGNLSALKALGDNADRYNRQDWQSWLDAQADVAPYAQSSQTPSAAKQGFSVAVSTLNKPSAWALMDLLEGSGFDMHNDLVGDNGLGKLAQLTPDSPEWGQLPEDKAVPDKATRQAMIDAAKLIGSPEQTANREALRALGANPESYNRQDWQSWLDAQPAALYDLNHWLGRLSQGEAEILKPIHVDRDHLSKGADIGMSIGTLGFGNALYTGTHKPYYSAEQQYVVDQLKAQGRDTTALEKAMEEAHDEWKNALGDSIGWAVFGVLAAATFVGVAGGAVASAAATGARLVGNVLGQAGRAVGGAIGGAVGVIDQAVVGGMGNLLTTLGAKVPAALKANWESFVKRADEGAGPQELTPLLDKSINDLDSLAAAGQLPPEGGGLLPRLKEFRTRLIRAMKFEIPPPKAAPQPPEGPAKTATPPPQPAAAKPQSAAPAATSNTEQPGHATAHQKTVASQHSEITAAEPDGAKNPAKPGWVEDVKWSDLAETKGQVTINGESFNVVKTKEGQVLTGKLEQGRSRFKEFDASTGQPTGALFYKADDGSGWVSGGLKGGGDVASTNYQKEDLDRLTREVQRALDERGDFDAALQLMRQAPAPVIDHLFENLETFAKFGEGLLSRAIQVRDWELALAIVAKSRWIPENFARAIRDLPTSRGKSALARKLMARNPKLDIDLLKPLIGSAIQGGDTADLLRIFSGDSLLTRNAIISAQDLGRRDLMEGLIPSFLIDASPDSITQMVRWVGDEGFAEKVIRQLVRGVPGRESEVKEFKSLADEIDAMVDRWGTIPRQFDAPPKQMVGYVANLARSGKRHELHELLGDAVREGDAVRLRAMLQAVPGRDFAETVIQEAMNQKKDALVLQLMPALLEGASAGDVLALIKEVGTQNFAMAVRESALVLRRQDILAATRNISSPFSWARKPGAQVASSSAEIQQRAKEVISVGSNGDLDRALALMAKGGDELIKEVIQTDAFFHQHGVGLLQKAIAKDRAVALKIVANSPWISRPMVSLIHDLPDVDASAKLAMAIIQHHPELNGKFLADLISPVMLAVDTKELLKLFGASPRLAKPAFIHAWGLGERELAYGLIPSLVKDAGSAFDLVCRVGDEQFAEKVVEWARGAGRTDIADKVDVLLKDVNDRLDALRALGEETVVQDASKAAQILTGSPWVSPAFFKAIADLPEGAAKSELAITVLERFSFAYVDQIEPLLCSAQQLDDVRRLVKVFGANPMLAMHGILTAWHREDRWLAYLLIPAALDLNQAPALNWLVQTINDNAFSRCVVQKVAQNMDLMAALSPSLIQSLGAKEFTGLALKNVVDSRVVVELVKSINRPAFTQQVREWALGRSDFVAALDKEFPGTGG